VLFLCSQTQTDRFISPWCAPENTWHFGNLPAQHLSISHVPVTLWCITCEEYEFWICLWEILKKIVIKCYTFVEQIVYLLQCVCCNSTESQFSKKKLLLFCKMREGLRVLWEKYYEDKLFEELKWLWRHKSTSFFLSRTDS